MAILLNLVYRTFETRLQRVYHAPFISEDSNFDLSTALFHVTRGSRGGSRFQEKGGGSDIFDVDLAM